MSQASVAGQAQPSTIAQQGQRWLMVTLEWCIASMQGVQHVWPFSPRRHQVMLDASPCAADAATCAVKHVTMCHNICVEDCLDDGPPPTDVARS